MKIAGVADTHAVVWYVFDDKRLSKRANLFIDNAGIRGHAIAVSSISLVEIIYLVEKGRVLSETYEAVRKVLANPLGILVEQPLTAEIVHTMRGISRDAIPDMPDRIVAATGVFLGVPVLSRDGKISASSVETIW